MTVISLSQVQKSQISLDYGLNLFTINELAYHNSCSRRTIIRVLEEAGHQNVVKKRQPKPKPVPVVIPTRTPWWKRITGWMTGEVRT
jgi:hypothetical protein